MFLYKSLWLFNNGIVVKFSILSARKMSNSSSKNHSKRTSSSRDRNKSVASESGGSSQCDTPPLVEKDGSSSQGKYAGVGPESILCAAEQIGVELNVEAATSLAEDVSYKLRQIISTISLQSGMMKKSRVDSWDVNSVLTLSDSSPVLGATAAPYATIPEEKLCFSIENIINVTEIAMKSQSYSYCTLPTYTVEWITDDKSLSSNNNISAQLQNYYTRVARAILNLKKKPKEFAVEDLTTNTRIGPIFPNLFNLAVLVLNDDNLNALSVPNKKPLQANVLDMVDALCSNPCSLDTNIQQQFQRLFPVMVSNILGNGSLAEKMVAILTKITRTWPTFISIGKGILFDYLSQGTKERLTAPMIKCVLALGRQALLECLADHLDYLDECAQRASVRQPGLRESLLDASTCLLRPEPTTFLEDFVTIEYTLYEILGDSILPRLVCFPHTNRPENGDSAFEKPPDEDVCYTPRPLTRRPKARLLVASPARARLHRDTVFEDTRFSHCTRPIRIKALNCNSLDVTRRTEMPQIPYAGRATSVVVASGLLNRFRYRLKSKADAFPMFRTYVL